MKTLKAIIFISLIIVTIPATAHNTHEYFFQDSRQLFDKYEKIFIKHEQQFKKRNPFTVHEIPRGDFQLHAREFGIRENRPTIILMHGFPDSLHLYDRVIPKLAKQHHVIAFDFLGWGASDTPTNYDYSATALKIDLDTVINYFELDHVILVMHDLSGLPAIDWALENSSQISGLVLLDTFYGPMPTLKAPEAIEFFATPSPQRDAFIPLVTLINKVWLAVFEEQVSKFFETNKPRKKFTKIFAHQSLQIKPAFFALTDSLFQEIGQRGIPQNTLLPAFEPPVRIIFGAQDPYLNIGVAETFHNLFANSELFIIENAGHYVQLDQPKTVSELIIEFANENSDNLP
jgi:pimeloyl-ACP methyl ester carboxylesterase